MATMSRGTHRFPPMDRVVYGVPLAEALAEEIRLRDSRAVYVMASGTCAPDQCHRYRTRCFGEPPRRRVREDRRPHAAGRCGRCGERGARGEG